MSVVYPVGRAQRLLRRALLVTPNFALVNVVAGREVVPERLVLGTAREADEVADDLVRLHAEGEARRSCRESLAEVREVLAGPGAARRAACAILERAAAGRPGD
jgi:lipid A disaccharide synthetase